MFSPSSYPVDIADGGCAVVDFLARFALLFVVVDAEVVSSSDAFAFLPFLDD